MPMAAFGKMSALVNKPEALKILLADPSSAGNEVSLKFVESYLSYTPAIAPEDFEVCPILLTQPAEDRWSPLALSQRFFSLLSRVKPTIVNLENAGHYLLEEPGLGQMTDAIAKFIEKNARTKGSH